MPMTMDVVVQGIKKGLSWSAPSGRRLLIAFQGLIGARMTGVWDLGSHNALVARGVALGLPSEAMPAFGAQPLFPVQAFFVLWNAWEGGAEHQEKMVVLFRAVFPELAAVEASAVVGQARSLILANPDVALEAVIGCLASMRLGEKFKGGRRPPVSVGRLAVSAGLPVAVGVGGLFLP